MFRLRNIDLDAIEVGSDDAEEVTVSFTVFITTDFFAIIKSLLHPNRYFFTQTSLTENKSGYDYGVP